MNFSTPSTTAAPVTAGFSLGISSIETDKLPIFSFGTLGYATAKQFTFETPSSTSATSNDPTSGDSTPLISSLTTFGSAPVSGFKGFGASAITITSAIATFTGFGTGTSTTSALLTGGLGGFGAAPLAATITAPAPALNLSGFGATFTPATTKPSLPVLTGFGTAPANTVAHTSQMSYNQLEEYINKWTLELEEQEKVFTEQVTQINAWDRVLNNNRKKIVELNNAVEKVKVDHQMLEQELEFIATQHKELEESIAPLQKEFNKMPQVDVERSQTYLMAENLDTQLKQMSEIIENLNEANKEHDSSDPIRQIGKILNYHMISLEWIESSSANISNKLEEIEKIYKFLEH